MKLSRFNIFVPRENDGQIIYNTLTGSITRVNSCLSNRLLNSKKKLVDELKYDKLNKELKNQGILVEKDFNELNEYKCMHKKWKNGTENVEFTILLTYDCNFECPYCYQGRGEEGKKFIILSIWI